MADAGPLVLYDISSPRQPRSLGPNPTKARLALRFKGVPFTTTWVDLPDITRVRQGLGCPPTRKFDDGTDFYTLPMLRLPGSGEVIGDSFEIATYLDDEFPDSGAGRLFPPPGSAGTGLEYRSPHADAAFYAPVTTNEGARHAAHARFNLEVDTTFSAHMALYGYFMPFNPATAEQSRAALARRAHLASWEDLRVEGGAREPLKEAFREALTELARLFMVNPEGPYLEGKTANYADLIVGGWLNFFSALMPEEEWREFGTWHEGVFGRLHEALQERFLGDSSEAQTRV